MSDIVNTILLPFLAGAIGVPVLGYLLSKIFPKAKEVAELPGDRPTRWGLLMEIVPFVFFLLGAGGVFAAKRATHLPGTTENVVLILSVAFLSMVGGTLLVSALVGDWRAEALISHLEARGRVSRSGIRTVLGVLSLLSLLGLIAVLFRS